MRLLVVVLATAFAAKYMTSISFAQVVLDIDCSRDTGEFRHFWRSTGFTPAQRLFDTDMRQNIIYIGSIPNGGISYVRVHNMLELVSVSDIVSGKPEYDWSKLDSALDLLHENGLKPVFELMGIPKGTEGFFTDFQDNAQILAWKNFVTSLVQHYIERYGREEVRSWIFETWNEPNLKKYWPFGQEAFHNYYDACSEGLREADAALTFGGPGSAGGFGEFLKRFIAHCDNGTNCLTGETGVRLDFISVHVKGTGAEKGCLDRILTGEIGEETIIRYVRKNHPRFAATPFANTECDPIAGWNVAGRYWHGMPFYAAWTCASIEQHISRLVDRLKVNYLLLSNDNGFVHEWDRRTLMARQGGQEAFDLIKKPVFNAMVLLSLLGDRRLAVDSSSSASVGVLATRRGDYQVGVLVFNHDESTVVSRASTKVELRLRGLPFDEAIAVHYRIDELHSNPFRVWKRYGSPERPSNKQLAAMRREQELAMFGKPTAVSTVNGAYSTTFDLPLPGVSLLLLSKKPALGPARVERVRLTPFTGCTGDRQVMVSWNDVGSRFIRTYEVLFSETPEGPFERINETDLICTAYLDTRASAGKGFYRIRAVDYWDRVGPVSEVSTLPLEQ